MKIAVVGHVEWGRFARLERVPEPGEIVHADEVWEEVAGGGGVAALQIAALNGACTFFTAVGDDELGRQSLSQLREGGVEVCASVREGSMTRSIMVHIDAQQERTITVMGDLKPSGEDQSLPWERLAEMDAVYFISGDEVALEHARKAKVLVSTARILPLLQKAAVPVDILLSSAKDAGERYRPGDLAPNPGIVVTTQGADGGVLSDGSRYEAAKVAPDAVVDTYGCGDSFAAALTYALGSGSDIQAALKIAAQAGAQAAQRRGAFANS